MAKSEAVKQGSHRATSANSPKEQIPALDVKQAVAKAKEYFIALFPNALGLSLEEVERSGSEWRITLGYIAGNVLTLPADTFAALRGEGNREYKVITIDANTGEALSMKIRKP